MKQVTNYSLQWNPKTNKGAIFVKYSDGTNTKLAVNSAEEFLAVALVLSNSPVTEQPDGTLVYTS